MLPPMWRIEACMNIAVNTVCQAGRRVPGSGSRLRASCAAVAEHSAPAAHVAAAQWMLGWCSALGIAPYLTTSCVSGPLMNEPPWRIASM